jgi:hypothetical protein
MQLPMWLYPILFWTMVGSGVGGLVAFGAKRYKIALYLGLASIIVGLIWRN